MERGCGLLAHITSLKDDFGYGCFSNEAISFVDFLKETGQKYWQLLPLSPVDMYGSPYSNSSLFAIEPSLISLYEFFSKEELEKRGLKKNLTLDEYKKIKLSILEELFDLHKKTTSQNKFEKDNAFWLDDYANYMTLEKVTGKSLSFFEKEYQDKNSKQTFKLLKENNKTVEFFKYIQFVAFSQWNAIKNYANKNGISIIGDMPFYPASDSDIVWAKPELFQMEEGKPKFVSGVPGDYFNEDGQVWNTPVYNVDYIKNTNYEFMIARFSHALSLFDYVRADHFRGYESFFKIPAKKPLAKYGKWEKGLGINLFKALKKQKLDRIILEDLGVIDQKVVALKEKTGFAGMKVYQFAFDGNSKNPFLPASYEKNSVAYLGTHDNDTFCGFLSDAPKSTKEAILKNLNLYENASDKQICYSAIGAVLSSNALVTILMPQDLLCQGKNYRINKPGTVKDNWKYQMPKKIYSKEIKDFLSFAIKHYNR